MQALISTAGLAAQLESPDLVVFDASWYLPNEGVDANEQFQLAAIPGAGRFDHDVLADVDSAMSPLGATMALAAQIP